MHNKQHVLKSKQAHFIFRLPFKCVYVLNPITRQLKSPSSFTESCSKCPKESSSPTVSDVLDYNGCLCVWCYVLRRGTFLPLLAVSAPLSAGHSSTIFPQYRLVVRGKKKTYFPTDSTWVFIVSRVKSLACFCSDDIWKLWILIESPGDVFPFVREIH